MRRSPLAAFAGIFVVTLLSLTAVGAVLPVIPRYVRGEMNEPCRSGTTTVHIDPHGMIRRCPDFPADGPWQEYRRYKPIACNACYYACRGEAQAPLRLMSRVRDVMA